MTLPNVITLARLALVGPFLWAHFTHRAEVALALFAIASGSDVLDGLLARVLDQKSKLGAFLDPLADKVLALSALLALAFERSVPLWLLALVLFRDGLMAVGALIVRRKNLELPAAPSRLGKYATLSVTMLVVLALAAPSSFAPASLQGWVVAVGFIAAMCIALSTVQYYARFGYLFTAPAKEASK